MLDQFVDTCLVLALCSFHVILYHINSDQLRSTRLRLRYAHHFLEVIPLAFELIQFAKCH
jgi:hypothetical protein